MEGIFYITVKALNGKPKTSIIVNEESLEVFPLKSGMRQGYLWSTLLFNILLEILNKANMQKRHIKGIQIICLQIT